MPPVSPSWLCHRRPVASVAPQKGQRSVITVSHVVLCCPAWTAPMWVVAELDDLSVELRHCSNHVSRIMDGPSALRTEVQAHAEFPGGSRATIALGDDTHESCYD